MSINRTNKYPTFDDLVCCAHVFSSHDDFSIVADLYIGYDSNFNLTVVCEHTDYDMSTRWATYAYVGKDEAYTLAKKLGVQLRYLPHYISNEMEEWTGRSCPMPKDVRDCFKDITDRLIYEGCHLTFN